MRKNTNLQIVEKVCQILKGKDEISEFYEIKIRALILDYMQTNKLRKRLE